MNVGTTLRGLCLLVLVFVGSCQAACDKGWNVWVFTSDKEYAGTDSDVYFGFTDKDGETIWAVFANPDVDDFERGRVDRFRFRLNKKGTTLMNKFDDESRAPRVHIVKNYLREDEGWFFEKLVIQNICTDQYAVYYNQLDMWMEKPEFKPSQYYSWWTLTTRLPDPGWQSNPGSLPDGEFYESYQCLLKGTVSGKKRFTGGGRNMYFTPSACEPSVLHG